MRISLIIATVLLSLSLQAQQDQLWFSYYSSIKLNKRLSINSDLQIRTTEWYQHLSQTLIRTGLSFKVSEHITASCGFADFAFFTRDKLSRNEYRPWEEIGAQGNLGSIRITNRLRIEQRFFQRISNDAWTSDYTFNHRFRYRLDLQRAIWKLDDEKKVDLQIGNEIMLNAGNVSSYFDQNRSWIGFQFTVNRHLAAQLHYLFLLQHSPVRNSTDQVHVIRLNFYHTIFAYNADNTTK